MDMAIAVAMVVCACSSLGWDMQDHAATKVALSRLPSAKRCLGTFVLRYTYPHRSARLPLELAMAAPLKPSYADALRTRADSENSDFPSLSGGPQPASNAGQSSWNSNILRQPPAQQPQPVQQRAPQQSQQSQAPAPAQQQVQQHQQQRVPSATLSQQSADQQDDQQTQQPPTDQSSSGGGEEFPPLGVRTNGELFEQTNGHGGVTLRSPDGPDGSQTQGSGQQTQLPFREASNAPAQSQQAPIGHPLTQTTSQQVRSSSRFKLRSCTNNSTSTNRKQYSQPQTSPQRQAEVSNATQT